MEKMCRDCGGPLEANFWCPKCSPTVHAQWVDFIKVAQKRFFRGRVEYKSDPQDPLPMLEEEIVDAVNYLFFLYRRIQTWKEILQSLEAKQELQPVQKKPD